MQELTLRFPLQAQLIFHIPNEGRRHPATGQRLKQEGMKAGVPDYFLPVPKEPYSGLFIELKRRFGGVVTPLQSGWLDALKQQGYAAHVAYGAVAAINIVTDYLKGTLHERESIKQRIEKA